MKKLMELTDNYKVLQNELDEIYEQIYKIMGLEVLYQGEKFRPVNFDIESEVVTIVSSNLISSNIEKIDISFKDFETLLEFYKLKTQSIEL